MLDALKILAGLILLYAGGEGVVRGSVRLAEVLGLSSFFISMLVVGFGTSLPELAASLDAGLKNAPDLAVGNVVGSNIANVLLILGVAGLIHPLKAEKRKVLKESLAGCISAFLTLFLISNGMLRRYEGALLLLILFVYMAVSYALDRRGKGTSEEAPSNRLDGKTFFWLFLSISGLAGLIFGADLLVSGARNIALKYRISEAVIGLTLIAIGTSLPELATAVIASLKKESDVVLGNVLGSNIFNILCILGTVSLFFPLQIHPRFIHSDFPLMAGVLSLAFLILLPAGKVPRWLGATFLTLYCIYIFTLY